MPKTEKERAEQFVRGHRAAAAVAARLRADPSPHAVTELLSALAAAERSGLWPGPRDPVAESRVADVRRVWTKLQRLGRSRARG